MTDSERSVDEMSFDKRHLTDEEVVLLLLDDNSGAMWQSQIVCETGWSKSKVSRVLIDMEESEVVQRVQFGRQNVVNHPDLELDDIRGLADNVPDKPTRGH